MHATYSPLDEMHAASDAVYATLDDVYATVHPLDDMDRGRHGQEDRHRHGQQEGRRGQGLQEGRGRGGEEKKLHKPQTTAAWPRRLVFDYLTCSVLICTIT